MPLLGGIFARTPGKQSSNSSVTTSPPDGSSLSLNSPTATSASSPTAEYVSFIAAGPSSPNGHGLAYAGEPPKRRAMGFFGRKKSGPSPGEPDSTNPRPAYLSRLSTASERPPLTLMTTSASSPTDGGLRPPPHPGLYNHSTRSLPPTRPSPSSTTLGSPLAPSVSPTSTRTVSKESRTEGKAGGRRFAFWGRGGAKDTPPPVPTQTEGAVGEEGDFNLRAFRHVAPSPSPAPRGSPHGSPSPAPRSSSLQQNQHQNTSKTRLTASALSALGGVDDMRPPQRPRAPSDVSASSSRISVAAFREMQSRRSAAGSPALGGPPVARDPEKEQNVVRTTGTGPRDKRSGSRSESGHGVYAAASVQGVKTNRPPAASTSHPHLPLSASAPRPPLKSKPQTQTDDDDESEESEEEESESDEDNAPLAMLVRRPGAGSEAGSSGSLPLPARRGSPAISLSSPSASTAPPASTSQNHIPHQHSHLAQQTTPPVRSASPTSMSSSSSRPSSNLRPKPKPLIDIAALTASRPQASQQRDAGFTGGGMLASFGATSSSASLSKMESAKEQAESPILTSRSPPLTLSKTPVGGKGLVHFPTPPGSPVAEVPPAPAVVKEKKVERRTAPVRSGSTGLVEMERVRAPSPELRRDLLSERLRAVTGVVAPTKDTSPQKDSPPPPPAFITAAQIKAFHRRSSSDIVSGSKGWGSPSVPAAAPPAGAEDELDLTLGRDLADLLGGGLSLVSRAGESSPPRVASGEDLAKATTEKPKEERQDSANSNNDNDSIIPVVIRQRAPPPAFSVTSRPAQHERQRSTTMVPAGSAAAEKAAASFNATNRSLSANVATSTPPVLTNAAPTLRAPPPQARPAKAPPPTEGARSSSYGDLGVGARPRSSTLIPNPTPPASSSSRSDAHTATSSSSNNSSTASSSVSSSAGGSAVRARPRSSTMMTLVSAPPATASAASPASRPAAPVAQPPPRPFMAARKSPASSTGDSSSSPAPLTPRDGSSDMSRDSGPPEKVERRAAWSGGVSGLVPSARRAHQRRSVSFDFDEEVPSDAKGKIKARPKETPVQEEERRRERRRSEAKAAIELGNVINGPGPVADDDDEDVPVGQRSMPGMAMGNMGNMPMGMNVPMPMGFASPNSMSPGWPGMISPAQFMIPPPADPNFYAAHQQAMMIAKQAYQMAVAQQAMAMAGDEWERGSTMGFGDRSSVFGGSTTGPAMGAAMSPYGMGMGMQGGWTPGGMSLFPPAPRSMYGGARSEYGGGGGARSEYGGGGNGAGWNSSRSVYGENFGPSRSPNSGATPSPSQMRNSRVDTGYFTGAAVPQSPNRPGATPRQRTASQPATPSRGAAKRQPPSSWKPSS